MRVGMRAAGKGFGIEREDCWGRLTLAESDTETIASKFTTLPGKHYKMYAQLKNAIENKLLPTVLMEEARLTVQV